MEDVPPIPKDSTLIFKKNHSFLFFLKNIFSLYFLYSTITSFIMSSRTRVRTFGKDYSELSTNPERLFKVSEF